MYYGRMAGTLNQDLLSNGVRGITGTLILRLITSLSRGLV